MNNTFFDLDCNDLEEINGGGLGGAIAGAILGGTAGLVVYTAYVCVTGEASLNGFWKAYTSCALGGAGIGAFLPV
jgi:hypothetical protein